MQQIHHCQKCKAPFNGTTAVPAEGQPDLCEMCAAAEMEGEAKNYEECAAALRKRAADVRGKHFARMRAAQEEE